MLKMMNLEMLRLSMKFRGEREGVGTGYYHLKPIRTGRGNPHPLLTFPNFLLNKKVKYQNNAGHEMK